MRVIAITRNFTHSCHTDFLLMDLNKCETNEELIFMNEVLQNVDYIDNPSSEILDILTGDNEESYLKLSIIGVTKINGTIQYGPIVNIDR